MVLVVRPPVTVRPWPMFTEPLALFIKRAQAVPAAVLVAGIGQQQVGVAAVVAPECTVTAGRHAKLARVAAVDPGIRQFISALRHTIIRIAASIARGVKFALGAAILPCR